MISMKRRPQKKMQLCRVMTLKEVKREESEEYDTNKQEDANDTIKREKTPRSGRVSRRPKRYEDHEMFGPYKHVLAALFRK